MKKIVLIFAVCFHVIILVRMIHYETKIKPIAIKEYTNDRVNKYKSELKEWKIENGEKYMEYLNEEFKGRYDQDLALGINHLLPDE